MEEIGIKEEEDSSESVNGAENDAAALEQEESVAVNEDVTENLKQEKDDDDQNVDDVEDTSQGKDLSTYWFSAVFLRAMVFDFVYDNSIGMVVFVSW